VRKLKCCELSLESVRAVYANILPFGTFVIINYVRDRWTRIKNQFQLRGRCAILLHVFLWFCPFLIKPFKRTANMFRVFPVKVNWPIRVFKENIVSRFLFLLYYYIMCRISQRDDSTWNYKNNKREKGCQCIPDLCVTDVFSFMIILPLPFDDSSPGWNVPVLTLIKKKIKFSSYVRKFRVEQSSCKVVYDEGLPIWRNAQIFHHIWGGR
jgi:hypothetical protein